MDSVSIERFLIWCYQAQRADKMVAASAAASVERRLGYPFASGDGCVAVARNSALGGPIAGGGTSSDLHPDAELGHAAIGELAASGLLRHFGRTGQAPEWFPGASIERRPVLRANGKPVRIYDNRGHAIGLRMVELIIWQGGQARGGLQSVEAARATYSAWHRGMVELGRRLVRGLVAHRLMGPASPAAPWEPPAAA